MTTPSTTSTTANETIAQLVIMGRLIDKHTEIHPQAAATIYDWLDGKNVFLGQGNPLESSREEQARVFIQWFREQVKKAHGK